MDANEENIERTCASYAKLPNGGTLVAPVRISCQLSKPVLKILVKTKENLYAITTLIS